MALKKLPKKSLKKPGAAGPAATPEQLDSHALIQNTLATYGLGGKALSDWVLQSIIDGKGVAQIILELEQRPEFKAAFPEIELRRNLPPGNLTRDLQIEPLSPAMILDYRTKARSMMRSYGLPQRFWDENHNFQDLIVQGVSLDELNQRMEQGSKRVYQAPPEVRAVFEEIFGTDGDLALFQLFVDPERAIPELENMVQIAEAGGAAKRLGFGLTLAEMQRMEAANITYEQAVEGFRNLDERRLLFEESLYERDDLTVGDQGIGAAFGIAGGDVTELERRAEAREASTKGKGGVLAENRGVTGLGGAGLR